MGRIFLKERRSKPIFSHHPWIFSGAIQKKEDVKEDGEIVEVFDARGTFIGRGYWNSHSQIQVRMLTWNEDEKIGEAFFARKIQNARHLREKILQLPQKTNAYRVVYSESDGLPGLIVDRYDTYLVVQFLTLGMFAWRELLLNILEDSFHPQGIYGRSDPAISTLEGLPETAGCLRGLEPPSECEIHEYRLTFLVDLKKGQKTGFFLDQRENRKALTHYSEGKRVLDCFAYTGAFSLYALTLGKARSSVAVEASQKGIELGKKQAALNGVEIEFREADLFKELRRIAETQERFDVVILDPPKFTRSKSTIEQALKGYHDINTLAIKILEPDGILVTCTCSQHISEEAFEAMLQRAALETGRAIQVVERRGQAPDHPVILSCLETRYMQCLICRIM
ncbi:MAG: class I SAM-dependent rRNA methyltransferase [Candidatus Tectomicrobia bacterium]|nr:class I SAM-dependent rRNA methyltransferase [Candidatus Tectomicrobia bacterium]